MTSPVSRRVTTHDPQCGSNSGMGIFNSFSLINDAPEYSSRGIINQRWRTQALPP
jgi:hypothetical protein